MHNLPLSRKSAIPMVEEREREVLAWNSLQESDKKVCERGKEQAVN